MGSFHVNLFRKKLPAGEDAQPLRRCLSAADLTFIGIGQMIGAGIFVLTGVAAATQAGPGIILSFVVAGIACAFVAFAYAELASCVGGCGAAYGYAYALFGEIFAWIIGWNLVFGLGIALAAVANGWSGYFSNAMTAMGMGLPEVWTKGPALGGILNVPAIAIILTIMLLLFAGVKQSAKTNTAIVLVKVTALIVFVVVAAFHIDPALWTPFMPYGWFSHTDDGRAVGVLAAASLVFFAYRGFQNISFAVEEARNPQRDVPIGILTALFSTTVLYLAVAGLLTAIAPYASLNVPSPVAFALLQLGINWGSALVAVGVIVGLTSTMLVIYYGLTRILFAMARDGLLPAFFSAIDPRTKTPLNATILCGLVTAPIAGRHADRNIGRARQRRHAGGIFSGVPRRDRPARDAARAEAAVQSARRIDPAGARNPIVRRASLVPAAGDAGPLRRLARSRVVVYFAYAARRRTAPPAEAA